MGITLMQGVAGGAGITNCNSYNNTKGPFTYDKSDPAEKQHFTGDHSWTNSMVGVCSYTGVAQYNVQTPCAPQSTTTSTSVPYDNGVTTILGVHFWHEPNSNDKAGIATGASGKEVSSDAEGAFGVNSCAFVPCGLATVTISGSWLGAGFSVSVGGTNVIWQDSRHYANTCDAEQLPALQPAGCPYPTSPEPTGSLPGGFDWVWDTSTCTWEAEPNGESPVVIDTKGNWGKPELFTNPKKGDYVSFDLKGDGSVRKFSWMKPDSGLAWLVLDEGDGVKNGKQLFGNYTYWSDQLIPSYPNPNGFNALMWYDRPAQGGDGNLILDSQDAIWPKLKLWFPGEHCYKEKDTQCQSRPEELHSLESEGIRSISMLWDASQKIDEVGNQYKFFTILNPKAEDIPKDDKGQTCCDLHQQSEDGRKAYDVWLTFVK